MFFPFIFLTIFIFCSASNYCKIFNWLAITKEPLNLHDRGLYTRVSRFSFFCFKIPASSLSNSVQLLLSTSEDRFVEKPALPSLLVLCFIYFLSFVFSFLFFFSWAVDWLDYYTIVSQDICVWKYQSFDLIRPNNKFIIFKFVRLFVCLLCSFVLFSWQFIYSTNPNIVFCCMGNQRWYKPKRKTTKKSNKYYIWSGTRKFNSWLLWQT